MNKVRNNRIMKVLLIAICLFISILGLIYQFSGADKNMKPSNTIIEEYVNEPN